MTNNLAGLWDQAGSHQDGTPVHIAEALVTQGYDVVAVEPNIDSHDRFTLVTLEVALKTADVLAVLVKHKGFFDASVKSALGERGALDFFAG